MNRFNIRTAFVCLLWTVISFATLAQAQNVITTWNAIASNTIIKTGGQGPAPAGVYFAYVAIATYDAVNAISRTAQPFYYDGPAWPGASLDTAAAAAAHKVLAHYFPSQQAALDSNYQATLTSISGSPIAKTAGMAVGEAAASALIAAREHDGLKANVTYTPGNGPGAWVPTPPAFAAPATPWLGQMTPFTFSDPAAFLPPGPTPLDSVDWERDYNITRLFGAAAGSVRTPRQTEIGIFWTENTAQQYARLFNSLATQRGLSTPETARFMAMLWTGYADSAIGCYNAKYHFGFWRPVTAIPAGGGNPNLTADAGWMPLAATPSHPEYPAAHGCLTGAVTTLIATYFHTSRLPLTVDSLSFKDGVHTHTFTNTDDFLSEVQWARIYAGFHYYHSVVDGAELGQKVAENLSDHYFRPGRFRHD